MTEEVINLFTPAQLAKWQPPIREDIIGQGILVPHSQLIIFGPYRTFKTMTWMNLAFCLVEGKSWLGFSTSRCRVLGVQCEVPQAEFRRRVVKYCNAHYPQGIETWPDNLYLWTDMSGLLKLDTPYGLSKLEKVIAACHPDVVILDPLYKMARDLIDNTQAVKLTDNLDLIMNRHRCCVIGIHHTSKPQMGNDGVVDRGSYNMIGASFMVNWGPTVEIRMLDKDHDAIEYRFDSRNSEELLRPVRAVFNRKTLDFNYQNGNVNSPLRMIEAEPLDVT